MFTGIEASGNVMAHAQKPDFFFQRNGRVPLNRRGRRFSRLLAANVCASTVVESSWNVMDHGDAREGKWRGNWRMEWVASTLHTTSEHGVSSITTADPHASTASSRLNWRPCRFKWTRPFRRKTKFGFCACAITFQTQSNIRYTKFRGSVKSTGYPLHSPVSSSLPLPGVTVCHHISIGVYYRQIYFIIGVDNTWHYRTIHSTLRPVIPRSGSG
jgi:hypothetical protein